MWSSNKSPFGQSWASENGFPAWPLEQLPYNSGKLSTDAPWLSSFTTGPARGPWAKKTANSAVSEPADITNFFAGSGHGTYNVKRVGEASPRNSPFDGKSFQGWNRAADHRPPARLVLSALEL